jgi:hypothetical protein
VPCSLRSHGAQEQTTEIHRQPERNFTDGHPDMAPIEPRLDHRCAPPQISQRRTTFAGVEQSEQHCGVQSSGRIGLHEPQPQHGHVLFTTLMRAGRAEVEMVLYSDGDHHLAEEGKPKDRIDYHRRIVAWLRRFARTR